MLHETRGRPQFSELHVIEETPEEIWNLGKQIILEKANRHIPKKKKRHKAIWLSKEAVEIANQRRAARPKCTEEEDRVRQPNVRLDRIKGNT